MALLMDDSEHRQLNRLRRNSRYSTVQDRKINNPDLLQTVYMQLHLSRALTGPLLFIYLQFS
jgi:hypothetical protein